ncbi:hypothetical protein ACIGW5_09630 [Streptomyces prasinus]|uniref:hypothetical protein n=1 Tax=Streptomyces prasinus TaxID=67345 RepID=UPI0037CE66E6
MDEDDCFPLLLSQRERSALELDILRGVSKVEVADFSNRHEVSEDDFLVGPLDLDKTVPVLLDESPPAA